MLSTLILKDTNKLDLKIIMSLQNDTINYVNYYPNLPIDLCCSLSKSVAFLIEILCVTLVKGQEALIAIGRDVSHYRSPLERKARSN